MKKKPPKVIREPVRYDYAAIHPEFLKMMAEIGSYANEKYESWAQYLAARLDGDTDPMNHIKDHWRAYMMGKLYDHFEGDPRRHLAAIAYNAMMRFAQDTKFGPKFSVFATGHDMWPWPPDLTRRARDASGRLKKRKKARR
jgi:hypothetical protein